MTPVCPVCGLVNVSAAAGSQCQCCGTTFGPHPFDVNGMTYRDRRIQWVIDYQARWQSDTVQPPRTFDGIAQLRQAGMIGE